MYALFMNDIIQPFGFKYHLNADNNQIYIYRGDLSPDHHAWLKTNMDLNNIALCSSPQT